MSRARRWGLAALAGVMPATLAVVGIQVADAAAAPAGPRLMAAGKNVTAERYDAGDQFAVSLDLGLNVVAGQEPIQVRAKRKSYAEPIIAEAVSKSGNKRLPAANVPDMSGLKRFSTVTIKDAKGKVIRLYTTNFCPNTYDSVRTRPDAPAQTPYPLMCNEGNPFTLGSVWGIQAGWAASTEDAPPTGKLFDLPVGKYTVGVTVNEAYRKAFGIALKDASVSLNLTVKKGEFSEKSLTNEQDHAHHGPQVSDYRPEYRVAAKRPAAAKAPANGPKPDLRSLPAWGISISQGAKNKWYVNFGATVWNAGNSPLLVDGFRRSGQGLMDAYQYFFDAQGNQVGAAPAGTMEWDARAGHQHWHFTDFAQYNLLRSDQKLAVRSGKEAFCLANTDQVDYTIPLAKWRPLNTDLETSCGLENSVGVREVLDIGNGDTYTQDRPGQSFDITGLPNGTYYIQVKANPAGKLSELSATNNTALRKIVLGGTAKKRTLTVPPVNGIKG
ncbi:lysyl oxidase family protein [Actinoplanes sp. Pm04-4]|uniref:Lysyl oxidase family protein n=1 Tax=Paractinoplanes pyxinae TaxID=2997416 RepID=A0ABT4B9G5_9ACTN|nr:lysyl oxidase family protein [Actinoplanes pyxinae]MCY1143148.1 lysyl oxidase family protein [Actinoplanes pyxinae]